MRLSLPDHQRPRSERLLARLCERLSPPLCACSRPCERLLSPSPLLPCDLPCVAPASFVCGQGSSVDLCGWRPVPCWPLFSAIYTLPFLQSDARLLAGACRLK